MVNLIKIFVMVTILGRLGQGTTQVEKSPLCNWATQFLTVAYDCECSSNVTVRIACISFGNQLCRKKKLVTARVFMLLKSCALADMFPFSLCKKKKFAIRHMNKPFFPTTVSIQSYDIGKLVGLRTYQHPKYIAEICSAWLLIDKFAFIISLVLLSLFLLGILWWVNYLVVSM